MNALHMDMFDTCSEWREGKEGWGSEGIVEGGKVGGEVGGKFKAAI